MYCQLIYDERIPHFSSDNNFVAARAFAGNITYVHGRSVLWKAEAFWLTARDFWMIHGSRERLCLLARVL